MSRHRFTLAPYGCPLAVELADEEALARVDSLLLPGWRWSDSAGDPVEVLSLQSGPPYTIYRGEALHLQLVDLATALQELGKLLHLRLGATARGLAFVHAGVVGYHGRYLMLPGRTYTGKSTLVEALVRAGAQYYSDEYALLDPEGQVHPFPRALTLRSPAQEIPARDLGWTRDLPPLKPGLIVVTHYRAAARLRLRRVTPGKAVLTLVENSLSARVSPAKMLPILARVASEALTLAGPRPEAEAVAHRLLARLIQFDPTD